MNEALYNTIKAQQANFPLPQPKGTVTVGTLIAGSGKFNYTGVYSKTVWTQATADEMSRGAPLKPQKEILVGGLLTAINIFDLSVQFNVSGRQGDFYVSIAGKPVIHAAAGQNSIIVDVGAATKLDFVIGCNGIEFQPDLPLLIERTIVGAGAMVISALPITIIYAPPVDLQKKNVAYWAPSQTLGNTVADSLSDAVSSGGSLWNTNFHSWVELASEASVGSTLLGKVQNPYAQALSTGLGVISGLLGSSKTTGLETTSVTTQNTLTVTMEEKTVVQTDPTAGGPGSGDLLFYLKNAKVCWFVPKRGGPIQLALLGWEAVVAVTVAKLKTPGAGTQFGLTPKTVQSLLDLDPFVAHGPFANLPASRYRYLTTIGVNGATFTFTLTYTLTTADMQEKVYTSVYTEVDNAGPLAFLDVGVNITQDIQGTLTHSSSATNTASRTIANQLELHATPDEFYSVEVWADVIFGTFAYRSVPSLTHAPIWGKTSDLSGKPLARAKVNLVSNGRNFVTTTDAKGAFAFRASTIERGTVEVSAGLTAQNAVFTGTPLTRLRIVALPILPLRGYKDRAVRRTKAERRASRAVNKTGDSRKKSDPDKKSSKANSRR